MKVDLKFVQLHESLFLNGINFGEKLYPTTKGGLTMYYDTDLALTVVIHKGEAAIIKNVASGTVTNPKDIGADSYITIPQVVIPQPSAPIIPVRAQASGPERIVRTAQVEDPTRQAPKTILRRAKYQGQESQGE